MSRIKKITEESVEYFDNLEEAADIIKTNIDTLKVQMLINFAIMKKGRAFKASWKKVNYK